MIPKKIDQFIIDKNWAKEGLVRSIRLMSRM